MTTATDVDAVVEATRHLHHFREGYAETLQWMAEHSVTMTLIVAFRFLEPPLRILGSASAGRYAERLHRIANDAVGDWQEGVDQDRARRDLEAVCREAAHAVADEFHRDSRACLAITEGRVR